jgi:hypothetical protein
MDPRMVEKDAGEPGHYAGEPLILERQQGPKRDRMHRHALNKSKHALLASRQ